MAGLTTESRRFPAWVENDILCVNLEDEFEVVHSVCARHPDAEPMGPESEAV